MRLLAAAPAMWAGLTVVGLLAVLPCQALDGGTLRIVPDNGWKAFEVITQGDNPAGDGFSHVMPGVFDGAGAWLPDVATLRIHVNHETFDASTSEIDIDLPSFQAVIHNVIQTGTTGGVSFVLSARQAYGRWSNDGGASWVSTTSTANTSFARFCSSQAYAPDTFGPGRGFVDQLYITGEEITGGRLFVLDSVNRDLYQLSGIVGSATNGIGGMPFDAWENAALLDTGETGHVAVLLSPDGGTQDMKLYVGEKGRGTDGSPSTGILARNGLAFGSWYYLNGSLPLLGNTNPGTFDTSSTGALSSSKLEDVDTFPDDGTRVLLGDQDSGVFTLEFDLVFGAGFDAGASSFSVTKIANTSGGVNSLNGPDNVDWTAATTLGGIDYPQGLLFINEDSNEGEIWMMNPDGSNQVTIGATTLNAESSGIFDLSELVGYAPASVLITTSQGTPSSMTVLINPDAAVAVTPGAGRVDQLLMDRTPTDLQLAWQLSCSEDDDYAVYSGTIGDFTSHSQEICTTGTVTGVSLPLPVDSRYYLIVPVDGTEEGSYGFDSSGAERPVGASTCGSQTIDPACP